MVVKDQRSAGPEPAPQPESVHHCRLPAARTPTAPHTSLRALLIVPDTPKDRLREPGPPGPLRRAEGAEEHPACHWGARSPRRDVPSVFGLQEGRAGGEPRGGEGLGRVG